MLRYFITLSLPKFKKLIRLCLPVITCLTYVSCLPFPHPIVFVCSAKLGKAKDLADRCRKIQALAEGSASELADAYQREEQNLTEASAMREEPARAAEQCTAAAVREKAEARIDELAEQLAAARWGAIEKVGAVEEKRRRATEEEANERADAERRLRQEQVGASLGELSNSLDESRAKKHEARDRAEGLRADLELSDATLVERTAAGATKKADLVALAELLSETEACLREARVPAETARAQSEDARAEVGRLEARVESFARDGSERV